MLHRAPKRTAPKRTAPKRIRLRRIAVAASVVAACFVGAIALPAAKASAYPSPDVSLVGHGWGHGMGMGQWGALGYSLDGLTYQQILTHYYGQLAAGGTTTIGTLSGTADATYIRVAMTELDDVAPIVTSNSPFSVNGVQFAAHDAARLAPTSSANTSWNVYQGTSGCSSTDWTPTSAQSVPNPTAWPGVSEPFPADGNLANEVLELCIGGTAEGLRGHIEATANSDHQLRTVSILPLEQYVADVTPAESPAYWGTLGTTGAQGEPQGFQSLEAQVVAARSFVMSDLGGYGGYADTCDLDCQTYLGIRYETALTSLADHDTAGVVVFMPGGAVVATTQYSSSTGGWTVASTFAAVPDLGDSVCVSNACNSHHTWNANVPVSAIEARFPSIGTLESLQVTRRDGNGDFGGRVLQMSLSGTTGSEEMTGSTFATDFASYGVQSYWFDVTSQPSGGIGGYWMAAQDGGIFSFGNAIFHGSMGGKHLNAPIVGMWASVDHGGYWLVASDGGMFSFGDAMYHGSMGGRRLNEPVVGMASTPDGKGYWLVASDGGIFSFGDAVFHGSTGNIKLNRPIVGMARNITGAGYWLLAQDGGIFSFGTAGYQGSLPGLGITDDTATSLLPTATGFGYLILCSDGKAFDVGDAPQLGDVSSAVPGYSGKVVSGASVPG